MNPGSAIIFGPYDRVIRWFLPLIPARLKPNHLTFTRLILSPLLIIPLHYDDYLTAVIAFACLAITDMLDGSLARLRNQVTDWGKVWDPIADKMLVGVVVVMMLLKVNLSLTVLVLAFELMFILGALVYKLHDDHAEIKANIWGKIKMNLQCLGVGLLMLGFILTRPELFIAGEVAFYCSLFFALMSAVKRGI